jgi:hypothetical protein
MHHTSYSKIIGGPSERAAHMYSLSSQMHGAGTEVYTINVNMQLPIKSKFGLTGIELALHSFKIIPYLHNHQLHHFPFCFYYLRVDWCFCINIFLSSYVLIWQSDLKRRGRGIDPLLVLVLNNSLNNGIWTLFKLNPDGSEFDAFWIERNTKTSCNWVPTGCDVGQN